MDATRQVYWERGQLVTALAKLYPAHIYIDPKEPDWPVVCVHLPTGTASWHFPDAEIVGYLETLPRTESDWDGHSTEEKYERLARLTVTIPPTTPATQARDALVAAAVAEENAILDLAAYNGTELADLYALRDIRNTASAARVGATRAYIAITREPTP